VSVSFVGRSVAMSLVSLLLNLLWIVFGGLWMALGWVIAAVVMAITIVGLPWARAAFSIAAYCFRSATRPYRATNISAAKTLAPARLG
jgi:uncharacterized membrane protein YccF (DUF307 family)